MSVKLKTTPQRSKNMSAIRGNGNQSTELKLISIFRKNGICGWRRHARNIYGKPDFTFSENKVAIFVDGCFWHGCQEIKKLPVTNKSFWKKKLENNRKRDLLVNKTLKMSHWRVIRFWEHELKRNPDGVVQKLKKAL